MKKGRFSEEQIIGILKRHEAGQKVADLAREHGISEATIYTWKGKYGGMEVSEAQRLKSLEDENWRLKHLVADLSLDKEVLKGVISKTAGARSSTARYRICREDVPDQRTKSLRAAECVALELPVSADTRLQ
jgi:putative transposase